MSESAPTADAPVPFSVPAVAGWFGLGVLVVATVFAAVDRQILLLVAEPLTHTLGLSDTQIGALNGIAISLVAAAAAFPMGWLADRVDRKILLAVCVIVWSLATAACGLAHTFGQLFACAIGIALGEAVLGPITYSFIPDLFPRERWILANYIFFLAGVVGAAAGLSFAGWVIAFTESVRPALPRGPASLEGWRLSLIAVAAPGPLVAILILAIRSAPRQLARLNEKAASLAGYLAANLRTFFGVFLGFGLAATTQGTIMTWTPIALIRVFHQTPAETGLKLGPMIGIGSLAGVLSSGMLVRLLEPRFGKLTTLRVAELGVLVAMLVSPLCLAATEAWQILALVLVQFSATTVALSLSPTILQFIAPANMRGRVVSLGGLLYIVMMSLSPVLVGAVSDRFTAGPRSLLIAMLSISIPCAVGAILLMRLAEKSLPATLARVEEM